MQTRPIVVHEKDVQFEGREDASHGGVTWRTLLSGDRTPTSQLTLGVAEVPAGEETPRIHRHAAAEAYYVLEGIGVVEIDGSAHRVEKGSAVFLPGDSLHRLRNTGSVPLRLVYVFPVDAFEDVVYVFPEEA